MLNCRLAPSYIVASAVQVHNDNNTDVNNKTDNKAIIVIIFSESIFHLSLSFITHLFSTGCAVTDVFRICHHPARHISFQLTV